MSDQGSRRALTIVLTALLIDTIGFGIIAPVMPDLIVDLTHRPLSSLIYGHPQGPTGMRLILEAIEELAIKGGGCGLFFGCAAGDTAGAVVVKVGS